jgi:hypothetical protein
LNAFKTTIAVIYSLLIFETIPVRVERAMSIVLPC